MMSRSTATRATLACMATIALFGPAQSMAECVDVTGKIFNTSHIPALGSIGPVPVPNPETGEPVPTMVGGVTTLGVVALNGGEALGKMKCALAGVWAGPGQGLEMPLVGVLPNFTHTISCDDALPTPAGEMHSVITLDTNGSFTGYDGQYTFTFLEHSVPRAGSGLGAFANTSGGSLEIEGTLNVATGAIDMRFSGEFCAD